MIQPADYFLANGFPVMMMPNGSEGSMMKPLSQSSSFQFRPPADESRRLLVLLEPSAYGHFQ